MTFTARLKRLELVLGSPGDGGHGHCGEPPDFDALRRRNGGVFMVLEAGETQEPCPMCDEIPWSFTLELGRNGKSDFDR